MTLNKAQREKLRGMFGGKCAYCGCELGKKWHADHVDPVNRKLAYSQETGRYIATGEFYSPQNDHIDNLFPSCAPCNIDKGASSLEGWRDYIHYRIVVRLRENSSTFRHAERFGVVAINPAPLVFWFEKYRQRQEAREGAL